MAAAIDAGADAVECDVRLSRDGVPVCVHDPTVGRTSDGIGRVGDLTVDRLRALDWGSWHPSVTAGRPAPADAGALMTLADVVSAVRAAPRPVGLFVETKHPSPGGSRLEAAVLDVLARSGPVRGPLVAMSFWPPAVARLRRATAGRGRAPVLAALRSTSVWLPVGAPDAEAVGIALVRRRPGVVAAARRRGRAVFVWTVDAPEDVLLCRDLGVDAIITNRPGEVRAMLSR